jgi:hypothetical protein
MRVLQDFSRGLDEIFGFRNPNNPNIPPRITTIYYGSASSTAHESLHVPGVDANAGHSATNTALAAMLQPTTKPHAEASDGPVQPASIPCEDGDFVICTRVARAPDNPDWAGDFDASVGAQRGTKLNLSEVKKLADDIQLIIDSNPGGNGRHSCRDFLNGILQNAQSPANPLVSTDPVTVLWAIFQQRGIYNVPNLGAGGYAWGKIGRGTAYIELNTIPNPPPARDLHLTRAQSNTITRSRELTYAGNALGEVIHNSGAFGYFDFDMGLATADYLGKPQPNYAPTDYWNWSNFWHPKVNTYCSTQRALDSPVRSGGN